jgi:hypothetical protein
MGLSRPMINLWVARGATGGGGGGGAAAIEAEAEGARQLSVLVVVFPFIHVAYGWLNELRSMVRRRPSPLGAGRRPRSGRCRGGRCRGGRCAAPCCSAAGVFPRRALPCIACAVAHTCMGW